jgi:hypothetical protein
MRTLTSLAIMIVASIPCVASYATVYNLPPDVPPTALVAGDVMNVFAGAGTVDQLDAALGSTINLQGGSMGLLTYLYGVLNIHSGNASSTTAASGGQINLYGGASGSLYLTDNSTLSMSGGNVNGFFSANNSVVTLSGGRIQTVESIQNSTLNISGGEIVMSMAPSLTTSTFNMSGGVLGDLRLGSGTRLNLSGGAISPLGHFIVDSQSVLALSVKGASLNGLGIPNLSPGVTTPVDVTNLTGQISGLLAGGESFVFQLRPEAPKTLLEKGAFVVTAPPQRGGTVQILVTLVPEPGTAELFAVAAVSIGGIVRNRQMRLSLPRSVEARI